MANAKFESIFDGDYSQEPVRPCFFWLWIFLFSTLRRFEPAVGRVGLRIVGGLMASKMRLRNLSRHAWILRDCSRCTWLVIWRIPSSVMRDAAKARKRTMVVGYNAVEAATFQQRVALELTLFTFWPPGPPLLANWMSNSLLGTKTCSLITRSSIESETAFLPHPHTILCRHASSIYSLFDFGYFCFHHNVQLRSFCSIWRGPCEEFGKNAEPLDTNGR